MPPEALIPNPKYNTSIDIFSLGVMMIHVLSGQWPEPEGVLICMEQGTMIPVSEAERQDKSLNIIRKDHPLMKLIRKCINNDLSVRPDVKSIVPLIKEMVAKNPPSLSDRLQMLRQIDVEQEEKVKTIQRLYHCDWSPRRDTMVCAFRVPSMHIFVFIVN